MLERRKSHQFSNIPLSVKLRKVGSVIFLDADVQNISVGGILLSIHEVIETSSVYEILISTKDAEILVKAKAWRVATEEHKRGCFRCYAAFEFASFSDSEKSFLLDNL